MKKEMAGFLKQKSVKVVDTTLRAYVIYYNKAFVLCDKLTSSSFAVCKLFYF